MRVIVMLPGRQWGALVAFAAPQEAAVVEHIVGLRVEAPIAALAGISWLTREFHEAVVER